MVYEEGTGAVGAHRKATGMPSLGETESCQEVVLSSLKSKGSCAKKGDRMVTEKELF